MVRQVATVGDASRARPKERSLAQSLVPLAVMGLVVALASLLISIVLSSPSTHRNLVP